MGVNNKIYSAVLEAFKARQIQNEVQCRLKKERLYAEIPRLKEIDDQMAETGLELVKLALDGAGEIGNRIEHMKQVSDKLKEERTKILLEAGYSESELEITYSCPRCKDTGIVDGQDCECFRKELIAEAYAASNLSSSLKNQSFELFDKNMYPEDLIDRETEFGSRDTMLMAYNIALDFVSEFDLPGKSLLFYGKPGLGKTYLSTCIAKELLNSGKSVIYQSSGKVFQMLEEYKFGRSTDAEDAKEKIDMLYYADLLILDDLGTEFVTSYTNAAFFDIVNTRLNSGRKTIISTNYNLAELEKVYSERVASRILGNYIPVKFFGEDIRVKTMK